MAATLTTIPTRGDDEDGGTAEVERIYEPGDAFVDDQQCEHEGLAANRIATSETPCE